MLCSQLTFIVHVYAFGVNCGCEQIEKRDIEIQVQNQKRENNPIGKTYNFVMLVYLWCYSNIISKKL